MKDLLDTFDYGYTIQDLKKILNHAVKDYEVEFGEPDKIIDTIYDMGYGYRLLENQCRIYLKSKSLVFVTIGCIYIIPFDKIIGYEVVNLKENAQPLYSATTTTTTTDTGNVIKRAVIGGALAGGVGAIIVTGTSPLSPQRGNNNHTLLIDGVMISRHVPSFSTRCM